MTGVNPLGPLPAVDDLADLAAVVPCTDPSCQHDHPPAVARVVGVFECHVGHLLLCRRCAGLWSVATRPVWPMPDADPLFCLVCGRGHECQPFIHYQVIEL